MLRILLLLLCMLVSPLSRSETESSVSLLDNRFRVDPTIEQISFVIYRKKPSKAVVLVRPDGKKYYAWDYPDNVSWYEENGLDIISIDKPMPGPWQAIGKITPKNNIILLSNLELRVDEFPSRLFEGERLKFTARLLQDGKPLVLQDFLERVRLQVAFLPYVENEEVLAEALQPEPIMLGSFMDDGEGLDEYPGDGIFTAEVPVDVDPGKYRTRIVSGNGVFLRAVEQTSLVYPSPMTVTFVRARDEEKQHRLMVTGEQGMLMPGSIAVTVTQTNPQEEQRVTQSSSDKDSLTADFMLPADEAPGKHTWKGTVFATEAGTKRPLILTIPESSFSVMRKLDVEKSTAEYHRIQEEQKRALELARIKRERDEAIQSGMLTIIIGNVVVILLGLVIWFVISKLRIRKVEKPEMQLDAPPKN
ncbi:TIGR03503 family protein [Vibrio albus]|uniref:TIGR03503 family protein n=1 Tax=Vibrio albus TaxID=2200953 RepID=A0A2U3BCE2_9VIBR|nr:TIGR03503 family protein [Vibrio albus]PWI34449.1 TIGR03503 family protein [Vibrio albus]